MKYLSNIFLFAISILLFSCQSTNIYTRNVDADFMAKSNCFVRKIVKGGDFWITTYQKITNKNAPYVFYIEGDGAAFIGRYQISQNPTPIRPMLLGLAVMDDRPNVVYISRPCQYTDVHLNLKCQNNAYWTNLRMSDEVVGSINEVINTVNTEKNKFHLIGYSGGGGIAVLIAARNNLVKNIITLSGNLDITRFCEYHHTRPMIGSLNPIEYVTQINKIPQIHISGGDDKIVPPFIADKFVEASNSKCVTREIFVKNAHSSGWDKVWQYILKMPMTCE